MCCLLAGRRFKETVECERIVVKAFLTVHEVCSFRAGKLPADFYQAKAEIENRKTTMFSNSMDVTKQNTQEMKTGMSRNSFIKDSLKNVCWVRVGRV